MIGVQTRAAPTQIDWRYLGREALLILLFAWALPIAGGMDGLISFRGQAGSALLFTLVAGPWLAHRIWARRRLPITGLELPLLALVLVQFASATLADVPRLSLPAIAQTVAYGVLFFLVLDLARSGWAAELIEKTLLIGGAIVVALAALDLTLAFQGWWALHDLPSPPPFEHRLYAVVGDANILAGFVNVLWPFALARALSTRNTIARGLLALLTGAALTIQAFAYSRGATLALALGLGVFALAWGGWVSDRLRRQVLRVWRWLVANPIWLVGLTLTGAALGAALGWRLLVSRNAATQAPATEARTVFWTVAWEAFQSDPWLGIGPGAFPQAMGQAVSTPPEHLFMNAHSLLFNTLAETGALGLAAGLALLAALAVGLWRGRLADTHAGRARWAATVAAWSAFLAHGMVDYHVRYLALSVPLLIGAALVLAEPRSPAPRSAPRTWPAWALAPIALALAAFSGYQLVAQFRLEQATLAGREGDWARAAERADLAAAADPAFGLYAAQAGYAYARLAAETGDESHRDTAIARYVAALEAGPAYPVWEADLAVLLQADGDLPAALKHLSLAQDLAPKWGLPAVLRGLWHEDSDEVAARSAFADALTRQPALAESAVWSATPLRRGVLAQWRANTPAIAEALEAQIDALLADGQLPEAQSLTERAWAMSPASPWVYRAWGALAAAQGAPTLAHRYLQTADWLQTVDIRDRVQTLLARADQLAAQGDRQGAADTYAVVWDAASQVSPFGWGYLGYVPQAHFVYQRDVWAAELVPQVPQVDFDHGLADRLAALAVIDPDLAPAALTTLEGIGQAGALP